MSTQAERSLQSSLLKQLAAQGYETLSANKTIQSHEVKFKAELERLNNVSLSTTEWTRIRSKLNVSMSEAFDILRHGIDFIRDDNSVKVLAFYDYKNKERNHFQVAEEVKVEERVQNRRLDVVVFLNGMPIIAGELKKTGSAKGYEAALNDINVYAKEGVYRDGLLKFVQLYFISDGMTTKYFATNLSVEQGEKYTTPFYWSDSENSRVLKLLSNGEAGWTSTFFKPEAVLDLLHQNMLKTKGKDSRIIVLRPYQLYAVERGLKRCLYTDESGYFWHATGSGKTLTSFMLARALRASPKFKKVIMILDRNDLANQTIEEYSGFDGTNGSVSKGRDLVTNLQDLDEDFVMTTMQSLAALLKRRHKANKIKALLTEPVAIIVDECHRSVSGDQFKLIKKMFPRAQFLGFTGTPILDENSKKNDGRLTKDFFGEPLHIYTTKNAIDDGNVLPFLMDEVDFGGSAFGDFALKTDEWKVAVAKYIAENLYKHTQQRNVRGLDHSETLEKDLTYTGGYTALLATPYVKDAYAYWRLLTPMLKEQKRTCATIFSGVADEGKDAEANGSEWLKEVYADYDSQFGTSFAAVDKEGKLDPEVFKKYLADLTKRIKNKEVDLVIVANMLLTGFDAKTLNTVYLDKNLEYHGLLQAMSRANRVYKDPSKQFGNVVLFKERDMKSKVDDAIRLFSNGRNVEGVVKRKDFVAVFNEVCSAVKDLRALAPKPTFLDSVEEKEELIEIVRAYGALKKSLTLIKTYDQWDNSASDYAKIGIGEQEVEDYYSTIFEAKNRILRKKTEENSEEFVDLELELTSIQTHEIDVAYINKLLRNAYFAPAAEKKKWVKKAREATQRSDDPEVQRNAEAILEVVDEIESGGITQQEQIFTELEARKEKIRQAKVVVYSDQLKLSEVELLRLVSLYGLNGVVPTAEYTRLLEGRVLGLFAKRDLAAKLDKIMTDLSNR